jgi:hypothetical protein
MCDDCTNLSYSLWSSLQPNLTPSHYFPLVKPSLVRRYRTLTLFKLRVRENTTWGNLQNQMPCLNTAQIENISQEAYFLLSIDFQWNQELSILNAVSIWTHQQIFHPKLKYNDWVFEVKATKCRVVLHAHEFMFH